MECVTIQYGQLLLGDNTVGQCQHKGRRFRIERGGMFIQPREQDEKAAATPSAG
ncbi:Uncharacterised protein [Serratia fonticola]|uniref:Uncharacterized protein n=1 Tax=Serratia fonticola TaxID=47917 RepID=A0A4U9TAH0_SERFO|nr:Uncharacterised protein [Serratia fonticola]